MLFSRRSSHEPVNYASLALSNDNDNIDEENHEAELDLDEEKASGGENERRRSPCASFDEFNQRRGMSLRGSSRRKKVSVMSRDSDFGDIAVPSTDMTAVTRDEGGYREAGELAIVN